MAKNFYTVWVGGGELTDNCIEDKQEALELARRWKYSYHYDDTVIEVLTDGLEHLEYIEEF